MKKLAFLLLIATCALVSCGENEKFGQPIPNAEKNIVGLWVEAELSNSPEKGYPGYLLWCFYDDGVVWSLSIEEFEKEMLQTYDSTEIKEYYEKEKNKSHGYSVWKYSIKGSTVVIDNVKVASGEIKQIKLEISNLDENKLVISEIAYSRLY